MKTTRLIWAIFCMTLVSICGCIAVGGLLGWEMFLLVQGQTQKSWSAEMAQTSECIVDVDCYDRVPVFIRDDFNKQGFRVYVNPNFDFSTPKNEDRIVVGEFISQRKAIVLDREYDASSDFPNHEFGHYLMYRIQQMTGENVVGNTFKTIFHMEKDQNELLDSHEYATTDPNEYFAYVFSEYCIMPDSLRKEAPLSYEYMEQTIEQFYELTKN